MIALILLRVGIPYALGIATTLLVQHLTRRWAKRVQARAEFEARRVQLRDSSDTELIEELANRDLDEIRRR